MKNRKYFIILLVIISTFTLESCGPLIISPNPNTPPPPWFYPNRIESVRYVYFPEYVIYYDLSLRKYLYLENNVWFYVDVLPQRYRNINFNRSKFVRIKGYRGDSIKNYHRENYSNSPRSSRTSRTKRRRN